MFWRSIVARGLMGVLLFLGIVACTSRHADVGRIVPPEGTEDAVFSAAVDYALETIGGTTFFDPRPLALTNGVVPGPQNYQVVAPPVLDQRRAVILKAQADTLSAFAMSSGCNGTDVPPTARRREQCPQHAISVIAFDRGRKNAVSANWEIGMSVIVYGRGGCSMSTYELTVRHRDGKWVIVHEERLAVYG